MPRKKKLQPKDTQGQFSGAARFFLALVIGGVIASTTVAVAAKSVLFYERALNPIIDDMVVRFVKPATGDIVGNSIKMNILAVGGRGVYRVEVYEYKSLPQPPIAILTGSGPYYATTIDITNFPDHGYATYYAIAYTKDGLIEQTGYLHVQIEKCASGDSCARVTEGEAVTEISGLTPGQVYMLSYRTKGAGFASTTARIVSEDGNQIYANCDNTIFGGDWNFSPECGFQANSEKAKLSLTFVPEQGVEAWGYLDDVVISQIGSTQNLLANGDFTQGATGWTGANISTVATTPVTLVKPFAPSQIYSVTSNLEPEENQRLGFWFFKGWPRAHYTWWTKLGEFDRPPLAYDPLGEYEFISSQTDGMSWYTPLIMWLSRESTDPDNFSFEDVKLSVSTDKGLLDICIPDLDWNNPLINGSFITSLIVDQNGNTYYTGKYAEPDDMRKENIAGLCACSNGTKIGQCTTDRTQFCNETGDLVAGDCRTCGCPSPRQDCEEGAGGTFACTELPLVEIDEPIL